MSLKIPEIPVSGPTARRAWRAGLASRRRRLLLGVAMLLGADAILGCFRGDRRPPAAPDDGVATVRLMSATLPQPLTYLAMHTWFAVRGGGERSFERWEVWQEKDAGGASFGHVHRDLMDPLSSVGGGPTKLEAEWRGPQAAAFTACLREEAPRYPDRDRYLAWPGPNSNTFVDVMLRACSLGADLPATAIGKDYRGILGASTTAGGTGVQVETPLAGVKIGLTEGVELHVLGLTFGVDLWPPAVKLPALGGRIGFEDR